MLNPEIVVNRRPIDRLARHRMLGRIASAFQPRVSAIVARLRPDVRDVLHGTILGHPLHAIVTDIPIGAWTVTAALDLLECCGGRVSGSDAALVVGLAGAGGAIVSGWADWSDTRDDPRTLGMAHAVVNGTAVIGYVASFVLRRTGRRPLGIAVALASYGIVSLGAYLGGELSYGMLLGNRHTAEPLAVPAEFTSVFDLPGGSERGHERVDFAGVPVLVSWEGDAVSAVSAVCTHRGANLAEGAFADGCVTCPWHDSVFALDDGRVLEGPATFPVPRFEARIVERRIELRALRL